jgi:hypothetical protein
MTTPTSAYVSPMRIRAVPGRRRYMLAHPIQDRINAIVVLTDGRNEYPPDNDLDRLRRELGNGNLDQTVRVFRIAFGAEADLDVMTDIAKASRAAAYDSKNPRRHRRRLRLGPQQLLTGTGPGAGAREFRVPARGRGGRMASSSRVFWWAGVFGVGLTELAATFGWLGWVPVLGTFVRRGGPAGTIAAVVLGTTIWVLLVLYSFNRRTGRERRLTRYALLAPEERAAAPADGRAAGLPADASEILARPDMAGSRYRARLAILERHTMPGHRGIAEFLLSARSALDDAREETPYGPVRALVWALPALGFMGTAAEMSGSIGGVGSAVAHTASYADLRDFLAQKVIPPLADAFGITLFALACTVVCHVLLSITHARAERFAVEVDAWALEQLAERLPPDPAGQVIQLHGDINRLATEVAGWRGAVASQAAGAELRTGELLELLAEMSRRLGDIRDGLDRDLIVSPRPVRDRRVAR